MALKRSGRPFDPMNELRVPAFLNSILETTLDVERFWARLGGSWPAGGSLLVAARKS